MNQIHKANIGGAVEDKCSDNQNKRTVKGIDISEANDYQV
jgi:hypothetical protein